MTRAKSPLGAVVLAAILLASAVMMPAAPGVTNQSSADTPTATPIQGTVQQFSGSEMASVPDSHQSVGSSTPSDAAPDVAASDGSQTMRVQVSGSGADAEMVLTDDQTHDGRWVSVSTAWLNATVGTVPEMVTIRHESGDTYQQPVRVADGRARWWVEEFSTNTVTFSGEVVINGNPAANGSQYNYDINDLDSASEVAVNLTGVTNTESEQVTQTVPLGGSVAVSPAGNADPRNESIKLTGKDAAAYSGSPYNGGSYVLWGYYGGNVESEVRLQNPPETLSEVTLTIDGAMSSSAVVDVYVTTGEGPDATAGEGTLVKSGWSPPTSSGTQNVTIQFDTSVNTNGNDASLEFVTTSSGSNAEEISVGSTTPGNTMHEGGTGSQIDASLPIYYPADMSSVEATTSDGATASFGTLSGGETKTATINLTTATSNVTVSGTGVGSVSVNMSYEEVTKTQNPGVELNNCTVSHPGTLNDSETVSLAMNQSCVAQGTNTVNVTVGDGSLSADAPAPVVDMELRHDASDRQTVDYTAEKWTSRYNVSKTYASDRSNAKLTIPFDSSSVMSMRTVEYRINGSGGWTSMASSDYTLDGTTLTANLSDAYGGTIPAGATVEVRANASKIDVRNGSVTILDATGVNSELNTKIRVDSASDSFRIDTANSRIHYAHNASYTTGDYWVADQQGQRIHLPNAAAGDELRVSTIPVSAAPQSGGVHLTVENTSAEEPAFGVTPGVNSGQTVEYTFEEAADGTDYVLWSQTQEVVRDSGTANSPLTLTDDDSEETLKFLVDTDGDGSASGGSSSSAGGVGVVAPSPDDFTGNLVPLSLVALAFAGLIIISRNDDEITEAGGDAAAGIEGALGGIPVVGPVVGSGLGGLVRSTAQLTRALAKNRTVTVGLMGAVALAAIQSGVVQVPDSTLPLLVLVGVAAGSFVALRETGNWDMRVWVGIVGSATVVTLVTVSDADPVAAVTSSRVFPILALGGLYLGLRGVQALRAAAKPDETTVKLEVDDSARTDGGEDR